MRRSFWARGAQTAAVRRRGGPGARGDRPSSSTVALVPSDWEAEAEHWVRWARTPGHDAYWYYRDSFFDGLVPPLRGRTLDVGCGEGRTTRDLLARGHQVVAIDSSAPLVRHARAADPDGSYLLADAAALPFPDASFDLVVAYNSLMDVADMPASIQEGARVLRPNGRLCASVTHPISDAGSFSGDDPDAVFTIEGTYFEHRRFEGTFERDGLTMTFRGWCYPLEAYATALEAAGLVIEAMREPTPAKARPGDERWRRLPMFLQWRAVKLA
jgi:SAM-dependent methyltransferase